jgi:hypothetical protein
MHLRRVTHSVDIFSIRQLIDFLAVLTISFIISAISVVLSAAWNFGVQRQTIWSHLVFTILITDNEGYQYPSRLI